MKLYPMKFEKVLIPKVWGGRNLEDKLNIKLPDSRLFGEAWEVSAHKNGESVVLNGELKGRKLKDLYEEYKGVLVGEEIYEKYEKMFPLLIKYLDVNDKLSIQVHPDDEISLKKHGEYGKYESWYIMYASDDAKLILGMKKGIDKETFLEKSKNNDFTDMFNEVNVKTGDIIDIYPGTVHASLEGSILLAEIQENSDITYRIYDFDRLDNGIKRELHLEDAAEVINFNDIPEIRKTDINDNEISRIISDTPYYTIKKYRLLKNDEVEMYNQNMTIISMLKGKGEVIYDDGIVELNIGETLFIPANLKIKIRGELEFLKTTAN